MPSSFARSRLTVTPPHRAKHGAGAATNTNATAAMVKMGFIWDALLSAVVKFDKRHGAPSCPNHILRRHWPSPGLPRAAEANVVAWSAASADNAYFFWGADGHFLSFAPRSKSHR